MSAFYIARLQFTAPLHLSRGFSDNYGESAEYFHSDALKSALFAVGLPALPEALRNLSFFEQFSVSSCFPFEGDRLFLPKPRLPLRFAFPDAEDAGNAKRAKRLQFLDIESWKFLLAGGELKLDAASFDSSGRWYCHDATHDHPTIPAFVHSLEQRVHRVPEGSKEDPTPYYTDRLYFGENAGLYFLFRLHNPDFLPVLERCLELLGRNGIGSDRSTGNGYFECSIDRDTAYDLDVPDGNAWMNLGLFLPKDKESLEQCRPQEARYALVKRGGFIAGSEQAAFQHLRKRSVYMFDAGSVFPAVSMPRGGIADLKPQWQGMHPVWRDGNPLFIKVKLTEQA